MKPSTKLTAATESTPVGPMRFQICRHPRVCSEDDGGKGTVPYFTAVAVPPGPGLRRDDDNDGKDQLAFNR